MLFNCIGDEAFNFQVVATVYLRNVLYEMHEILEKRTRMVIKKCLLHLKDAVNCIITN